jgi:hypothetical protein
MADTASAPYLSANASELARLRALVTGLTADELRRPVNEYWSVAGVLAHMAFWDSRVTWLADKIERGEAFTPSDAEPDDVTWINDVTRTLIESIPPKEAASLAVRMAEEADRRVAGLRPDQMWPMNQHSLLNAYRAEHRREHLDEIESSLA